MKLKLLFAGLVFSAITANAQVATLNETFESFTTGIPAAWPQSGWSKIVSTTTPRVYADGTADKYAQMYAFFFPGVPAYLVTPQIVTPDGTKSIKFNYALTTGSAGAGTLQVGLVSDNTTAGAPSFTAISPVYNVTSITEQTVTVTVPASTAQYIAFKFVGGVEHAAVLVDDIIYDTTSVLGTSDAVKSADQISFAANTQNTALQFVGKVQPKTVEIYSAAGQQVAAGKVNNGQFDITSFQSGVYYILIETTEGKAIKSKFIKK
ncbi:T9SS type A sorting domain-containing protein [Chryseobacterium aahli]|uniref:T9SS-dependent choice-of-anchor J family protein n=1 Tax=Chryseobacterium aahli TaxID=1278643 RepID=UPI001F61E4F3|nr:choice-of-anchor J domain-containing protein [Chryseobacterium aahli]MCI3936739.1 T9SS type A sorting domain-containing protein [Chryseobacterium aahli]